jgi:hypothetical protein
MYQSSWYHHIPKSDPLRCRDVRPGNCPVSQWHWLVYGMTIAADTTTHACRVGPGRY